MKKELYAKKLHQFISSIEACYRIAEWLIENKIQFKITKDRKSKFGDFRVIPGHNYTAIITINGSLGSDHFLYTTLHEFAHFFVWQNYKSRVKPHGKEWKLTFGKILLDFQMCFSEHLQKEIPNHALNPTYSSSANPKFYALLEPSNDPTVMDVPVGTIFSIDKRTFKKLKNRRTKVLCEEITSGREFLVSGSYVIKEGAEAV